MHNKNALEEWRLVVKKGATEEQAKTAAQSVANIVNDSVTFRFNSQFHIVRPNNGN